MIWLLLKGLKINTSFRGPFSEQGIVEDPQSLYQNTELVNLEWSQLNKKVFFSTINLLINTRTISIILMFMLKWLYSRWFLWSRAALPGQMFRYSWVCWRKLKYLLLKKPHNYCKKIQRMWMLVALSVITQLQTECIHQGWGTIVLCWPTLACIVCYCKKTTVSQHLGSREN